jgi:methylisocitrate lyase
MPKLRERLAAGGVVAPGANDALTAVLVERAGFDAVYRSGFAFEALSSGPRTWGYRRCPSSRCTRRG